MIINANEISSVLMQCKKLASLQEFTPLALKCFKFQGNRIMAMDRYRGIVYELDNGYDFGEFLTAANFMVRVFSHVEGEAEIKVEGNHIKIEAGTFRTRIPLYRERYPFPEFDLKDSKCLPRNLLCRVQGYIKGKI